MPRGLFNDLLQSHQFHLLDVDFSLAVPPWVLLPSVGFSNISAPEMTIGTHEINEGTDPFVHHVLGKATTSSITLSKGVGVFNADFWRWFMGCLKGNPPTQDNILQFLAKTATLQAPPIPGKRRNMALMHLTGMSPAGLAKAVANADSLDQVKGGLLLGSAGTATAILNAIETGTGGIIDFGISSIPGKVFMLFDCLPIRYKPASDFDASTGQISIEELEIQPHRWEEFSLLA